MEISYLYDILGQLTLKMPDTETLTSISHLKLVNVIERKENNYLFTVSRKKKNMKKVLLNSKILKFLGLIIWVTRGLVFSTKKYAELINGNS